jgi:hypothetical protein
MADTKADMKMFRQLFVVDGRYKGRYACYRQIRRQIQHPIGLVKKRAFWPNLADTEADGERKTYRVADTLE